MIRGVRWMRSDPPRLVPARCRGTCCVPTGSPCLHLFVSVGPQENDGAAALAELLPSVTSGALWTTRPDITLNISFTYAGLAALGVPGSLLGSFPPAFREGMAARAAMLGDTGPSDPRMGAGLRDRRRPHPVHDPWHDERGLGRLGVASARVLRPAWPPRRHRAARRAPPGSAGALRLRRRRRQAGRCRASATRRSARATSARSGTGTASRSARSSTATSMRMAIRPPGPRLPSIATARSRCGESSTRTSRRSAPGSTSRRPGSASTSCCCGPSSSVAGLTAHRSRSRPTVPTRRWASTPIGVNAFDYSDDPTGIRCPLGAHIRRTNPRAGSAPMTR